MPRGKPRTSAGKGSNISSRNEPVECDVPYAKGFKPPSKRQIFKAIGCDPLKPEFNPGKEVDEGFEYFQTVPKPTNIDDWLAQYDEDGQSYQQFLNECPWLTSRKRKYMSQTFVPTGKTLPQKYPNGKIYILPLGDFLEVDDGFYNKLLKYTEIFLGLPVVSVPGVKLEVKSGSVFWVEEPEDEHAQSKKRASQRTKRHQLTTRFDEKTKRFQIRVDSNLMQLRQRIPHDAICMIGLTMFDLYGDDSDLFVAGMAAGNHRVAIFSLYRYDPCLSFSKENWFEIKKAKSLPQSEQKKLMLQRGCKLLVHEIGHLLGIDHCIYFDCCMNGSGHLEEDFRQPMYLCPVDLHKLHTLVGFDVKARYQQLLNFFHGEGMEEEEQWYRRRINFLQEAEPSNVDAAPHQFAAGSQTSNPIIIE